MLNSEAEDESLEKCSVFRAVVTLYTAKCNIQNFCVSLTERIYVTCTILKRVIIFQCHCLFFMRVPETAKSGSKLRHAACVCFRPRGKNSDPTGRIFVKYDI